jgi:hypothetical protein
MSFTMKSFIPKNAKDFKEARNASGLINPW